jgi:hypothetical protein
MNKIKKNYNSNDKKLRFSASLPEQVASALLLESIILLGVPGYF